METISLRGYSLFSSNYFNFLEERWKNVGLECNNVFFFLLMLLLREKSRVVEITLIKKFESRVSFQRWRTKYISFFFFFDINFDHEFRERVILIQSGRPQKQIDVHDGVAEPCKYCSVHIHVPRHEGEGEA